VECLPHGRYGKTVSRGIGSQGPGARARPRRGGQRAWGRVAILASAATLVSLVLPSGIGSADSSGGSPSSSFQAIVAKANQLSNAIDALSQQYDALKIQLTEARLESKIAQETAQRDELALSDGQAAVAQIAAQAYMTGGLDPSIQLLQAPDSQQVLNRASIMLQLSHEQTGTMSLLASAEGAANRARQTADQQAARADQLAAAMNKKVGQMQAKENVLNSSAFAQALTIFQQTGHYPTPTITGDSLGEQALRAALTRIGDPYVWGAAGPSSFDCSGLVMWAYAQVGISLDHFTGDQWNEGEHISRSQLQPGDLVFFFADISHVGMYVGNGMMVDAPTFGQTVQIQPVFWSAFVGAVRII
jgi:cell wall-associated NlpC family hydrolase